MGYEQTSDAIRVGRSGILRDLVAFGLALLDEDVFGVLEQVVEHFAFVVRLAKVHDLFNMSGQYLEVRMTWSDLRQRRIS